MAGAEDAVFGQLRDAAKHAHAVSEARLGLPLKRRRDHWGCVIEQYARDAAVRQEIQKSFQNSQQGRGCAAAVDNEHDRRFRLACHRPGAVVRTFRAGAVIIAHDALDHGKVPAVFG